MKKQAFFRIIAPLALAVNEEIQLEREELAKIMSKDLSALSSSEKQWLGQLAEVYKVSDAGSTISEDQVTELWKRVDMIPLSLVLAQSVEESGWGTSRFAAEGNALFGQWAWGENAMKPKEQRSGMGDYGLARFDSPLESMRAYMRNLNSHTAYQSLRDARAELREQGKTPDGVSLARTLTRYSERGEEYVNTLLGIMQINNLATADEAYLKRDPVILLPEGATRLSPLVSCSTVARPSFSGWTRAATTRIVWNVASLRLRSQLGAAPPRRGNTRKHRIVTACAVAV